MSAVKIRTSWRSRAIRRPLQAHKDGRLKDEIIPFEMAQRKGAPLVYDKDEGPRADTSMEILAGLQPAFKKGGSVTAGNSSPITDGAAAVLLMTPQRAESLGIKPAC